MTGDLGAERVRRLPRGGLAALLDGGGRTDLVNLAVGTPGFPGTPLGLVEEACAALRSGLNQYEDPNGYLGLREQIAEGLPGRPDPQSELTITVGGSEGLCVALLTVVNPDDEVIVLEPFYENFLSAIALAGGRPRIVRLHEPGWTLDHEELAAAFSPQTRALILNSPSNPTGHLLRQADLELIADLCQKWDTTVVSDEVYARFVYAADGHCSVAEIPGLSDRSIVIGSLSKSHAISGWRIGYLRAPTRWTSLLRQVHVATTAGAAAPLQRAAAAGGDLYGPGGWDPVGLMRARRDRTLEILGAVGFQCSAPDGGCYVMAGIEDLTGEGSTAFARTLAAEASVLVAPAATFFADPQRGARHVRVAFNRTEDTIEAAGERLLAFAARTGRARRETGVLRAHT